MRKLIAALLAPFAVMAWTTAALAQFDLTDCELSLTAECSLNIQGGSTAASAVQSSADAFIQQQLNSNSLGGALASPTGRLRHTTHDGLKVKDTGERLDGFETNEESVFANVTYDVPGTIFGAKLRIGGLVGYDHLQQNADADARVAPYQFAKTEIDSIIYGGSMLWTTGNFYSMSVIIGFDGDLDMRTDALRDSYGVDGIVTSSVMGYVFDLGSGLKFDLRGGYGYTESESDSFVLFGLPGSANVKARSEAWNGNLTGTLFSVVELSGGAVIRPYILGQYRQVFGEELALRDSNGNKLEFEQADSFGKAELGFDLVDGIFTYGAAAYSDVSSDQTTFGARLGVSVKFQ